MTADDHLQCQSPPSAEQLAWVFNHLNVRYEEGGSFQYLINAQMGDDQLAYGVLVGQDMVLSKLINCAKDSEEVSQLLLECSL